MVNYKLLTPGPLTTTDTVKQEMMADHCTWDDDYKQITQKIRRELLELAHVSEEDYTAVLMQGSGSFGVESVITSTVGDLGIDFLISSANKCIQGVPGFSFIICSRQKLLESAGKARSLSLDLCDQWKTMEKDGKWRFTSPTHTVLAFAKAIEELKEEGGIPARSRRYYDNNRLLIRRMKEMGIRAYIGEEHQGPIITTFFYPEHHNFSFQEMYAFIKERGYAIYPGKVTDADTFRIGNIGEIYEEDILKLCAIFQEFFARMEAKKAS